MLIQYEQTGFQEETKPGKHGQSCPYCGENHMVLPPDSNGVVMHCTKMKKPVAKIMAKTESQPQGRDIIRRQAEKLVGETMKRVRHHASIKATSGHCGICGSKQHKTDACPREGMPI